VVRLTNFVIPEIFYRESGVNKTRFPLKTCGNDKQVGFSDEDKPQGAGNDKGTE